MADDYCLTKCERDMLSGPDGVGSLGLSVRAFNCWRSRRRTTGGGRWGWLPAQAARSALCHPTRAGLWFRHENLTVDRPGVH